MHVREEDSIHLAKRDGVEYQAEDDLAGDVWNVARALSREREPFKELPGSHVPRLAVATS